MLDIALSWIMSSISWFVQFVLNYLSWPADQLFSSMGLPAHVSATIKTIAGLFWWMVDCVSDASRCESALTYYGIFVGFVWLIGMSRWCMEQVFKIF